MSDGDILDDLTTLEAQLGEESSLMSRVDFFFNKDRKELYFEMILIIAGSILLAFVPFVIGKWMDIYKDGNFSLVSLELDNTVGLALIVIVFIMVWYYLISIGRSRYVRNIAMNKTRRVILEKIDRKEICEVEKRSAGKFVEYISNEQQNLSRMFNSDVLAVAEGLCTFGVVIVLMFFTSVQLALIYVILLPVTYIIIHYVLKSMKKDIQSRQKSFVKINSYLDDVSSNFRLIKMYSREKQVLDHFVTIDEKLSKSYRHVLYASGYLSPTARILENCGFIISGIIGVILLNNNSITAGMFLTFISYASLMGKPLTGFAEGLGRLKDSSISMKRVCKFLTSAEDERHGDLDAGCSNGDISFRDVTCSSHDGRILLDSVTFDIRHGEHISVVGESGSGKTSFVDLMVALQAADSGTITYGGKDVFEYEKNSLRHSISVIPAIPWVLHGTIMENLRVASPEASDEDVIKASKFIGFDRLVERRDKGYDTEVSSGIGSMSLGEKQMMSLVRLILTDPKVVIFDDSFSGMDALTALRIKEKMTDFLQGRTVITVSDDVSDMVTVDRVMFIKDGRLITGIHEELIAIPEYVRILSNVI